MSDAPKPFVIETPSIATPGDDPRNLLLVQDVIPPSYPNGCEMVLMRPGELKPVVSIPVPVGHMIALVPPHLAVHWRQMVQAALADVRAKQEKQAREVGNRGQ
jgi:hypothetical protein